jgi:hypothetical protein
VESKPGWMTQKHYVADSWWVQFRATDKNSHPGNEHRVHAGTRRLETDTGKCRDALSNDVLGKLSRDIANFNFGHRSIPRCILTRTQFLSRTFLLEQAFELSITEMEGRIIRTTEGMFHAKLKCFSSYG